MTLHNRAAYVGAAVRSVLTQTFGDFELVVWDDGSTDDSVKVARAAAAGDPRVRVIESAHQGLSGALRAAHEVALAPLVGWVDSDDLLVTSALAECTAELARRPDADLVYTQHLLIDEHTRQHGLGRRCLIPFSPERLLVDFMTYHFRLFRRPLYERVRGIDAGLTTSPDYDFCLRASEAGVIVHLPRALYCYRVHAASVSRARREEQTRNAALCVSRALARRGMSGTHRLEVSPEGKFSIVRNEPRA